MQFNITQEKSPGDLVLMDQNKPSCDASTSEVSLPKNYQQLKHNNGLISVSLRSVPIKIMK
jgi:hypothetical protein